MTPPLASSLSHCRRRCCHHCHFIVVESSPLLPFVASLSLLSHRFHCHRRHHLRVIIVAAVSTVPSPSSLSCCHVIVVAVTVTVASSFRHCRRQLPVIVVALLLPSPSSLSSMPLSLLPSPSTSRRHFIGGFIAIARRRGCHVVIDAAVAVVTAAATVDVARCHSTLKGVQWQWSRTAVNLPVCAIAGNFQHGMK